jgi:DNA-binding CsgD family transcriptional regulator
MSRDEAFCVFESLTAKQLATLELATKHFTSKQIARQLGVAPVTIDKRMESVRARLGSISRPELLSLYDQWRNIHDKAIDDTIILGQSLANDATGDAQSAQTVLAFEDSLTFDERTSWDPGQAWSRPGLKPSDLGVVGKLLAIIAGALAMVMVAVLCVAFADAFMSIMTR